ncbi:S-adenosyl-L-methionine-dependent methyltransferase [Thermothelomyces heterothallicus CBS 202.75]|uniref:S-adenosyl-L-methionine-dependent methyltransferase n=1 Tax=Thermothelomyces heterothallicus CBS 202.75 TaxID=1149848 RepID=UPI003741FB01
MAASGEPDDVHNKSESVPADDFETASAGSISVTSSVYAHTTENGRRYQHFRNGCYPIPNDEEDLNREEMKHAMMLELCDGAGAIPDARVSGIDLSPTQPLWVPSNVDFLVDDCEEGEWLDRDVDFVHLRFMTIVLRDVPRVLSNAFQSLKPGGWIELQELCVEVLCDDSTMPDDDPFGMDVTPPKLLEPLLRDAGFHDIQCIVKKVPIGPWVRNETLRLVGLYQKTAVLDLMPALSARPFTALGMSRVESQVTLAEARKAPDDMNVHRYFYYYFWFAQKPPEPSSA